jgi:hypothetical protein
MKTFHEKKTIVASPFTLSCWTEEKELGCWLKTFALLNLFTNADRKGKIVYVDPLIF